MNELVVQFLVAILAASLSIAGLAGLIGIFRGGDSFTQEDTYLFRSITLFCLLIAIAALLPFPLALNLSNPETIWTVTSLVYAIVVTTFIIEYAHQVKRRFTEVAFEKLTIFIAIISVFSIIGAIDNAIRLHSPVPYIWSLLWALTIVSFRLYLFLVTVTERNEQKG